MKKSILCIMAISIYTNALFNINAQEIKVLKIGKQTWMSENLSINIPGSWNYNDNDEIGKKYGRLYTWDAAKNACPSGFRLPSDDDWTELANTLGGEDIAAKMLKPSGNSGFNAHLGGFMDGHSFRFIDNMGGYWSSSTYDDTHAWYRFITNRDNALTKTYFSKNYAFAVRCIRN